MSSPIRICSLPGDGIGPEVTSAALDALRVAGTAAGLEIVVTEHPIGAAALRSTGSALPPDTLEAALASDAVLLGAVGHPDFDDAPPADRPEVALLGLRRALGVFANLRPAAHDPALESASPLRPEVVRGADLLIVRELLGGIYFGEPRGRSGQGPDEVAVDTMRYSVGEVERVARVAFEAASQRRGRVTSVDKANVLESSRLWRDTVSRVALEYPGVECEHLFVDACAMHLVTAPTRFDVIVTGNLFGDVLSDEAAVLFGTLGMLPSASVGGGPGLFEPVHGSAPDLAGKDRANPSAAMLSAALLLDHTPAGDEDRRRVAAKSIRAAIANVHASSVLTADLCRPGGGASPVGTAEFARHVVDSITATVDRHAVTVGGLASAPCWRNA